MKEMIILLLRPFAQVCNRLVNAVSTDAAAVIYILVIAAVAVWVLTLKQEKPKKVNSAGKGLLVIKDLRYWAVLILLLQIIIYVVFR